MFCIVLYCYGYITFIFRRFVGNFVGVVVASNNELSMRSSIRISHIFTDCDKWQNESKKKMYPELCCCCCFQPLSSAISVYTVLSTDDNNIPEIVSSLSLEIPKYTTIKIYTHTDRIDTYDSIVSVFLLGYVLDFVFSSYFSCHLSMCVCVRVCLAFSPIHFIYISQKTKHKIVKTMGTKWGPSTIKSVKIMPYNSCRPNNLW